jgi:hypothetical protein
MIEKINLWPIKNKKMSETPSIKVRFPLALIADFDLLASHTQTDRSTAVRMLISIAITNPTIQRILDNAKQQSRKQQFPQP